MLLAAGLEAADAVSNDKSPRPPPHGPRRRSQSFLADNLVLGFGLQTRHFAAFGAAIEVWDHFAAFAAFREAKENKSYIDSKL